MQKYLCNAASESAGEPDNAQPDTEKVAGAEAIEEATTTGAPEQPAPEKVEEGKAEANPKETPEGTKNGEVQCFPFSEAF